MTRFEVIQQIETFGVVAVIRLQDPARLRAVVDAIAAGGVRALEVTMTVPRAVEMIAQIAPTLPKGFLIGAGTVLDKATVNKVINAGAQFIVSPVFRKELIMASHVRDIPAMPGCMTPTEILDAWDAGADVVKVFPATTFGPGFLKDVLAPLPDVKLMPTGGVTLDNAGDWIRAGAIAVGVGSALLDSAAIAAGRYDVITENARRIVASVAAARDSRRGGTSVPPSSAPR
jgi:2-dehydro-3-deoxyphosphogluconate aldolase/(4S)-4-hydroxy-2-oxoglutarate aldolase